jgi:hypothetical protein
MVQETEAAAPQPSFARFILWEILGIVGFLHILMYAPANESTPLYFLANAVIFLVAYPVLYFFNQLRIPAVLKMMILPLQILLRLVLLVSCFFWIAYVLYGTGCLLGNASCYTVFRDYWMFLGPFYVFDYFFFIEHLWGLSRVNFTFWSSVGLLSDSVSGVVAGFYLGRILITKWGMFFGDDEIQALIRMALILLGMSLVVWFGNKTRKG